MASIELIVSFHPSTAQALAISAAYSALADLVPEWNAMERDAALKACQNALKEAITTDARQSTHPDSEHRPDAD